VKLKLFNGKLKLFKMKIKKNFDIFLVKKLIVHGKLKNEGKWL